jgi:hypothetical protein
MLALLEGKGWKMIRVIAGFEMQGQPESLYGLHT